ncbi:MAG: tetratricopeptide repeat protein [Kofleriaceae bacterium]
MRKLKSVVICAGMIVSAIAFAEPKTADDWYKEGETQYNLGDFDKAADAFKKGFALEQNESKKPAYLYNVAQAYRQGKNCKDAGFFYKRYLSLKEQDTAKPLSDEKRKEIEGWIAELDECEKTQNSVASKNPTSTLPKTTTTTTPTTTTTTPTTTTTTTPTTTTTTAAKPTTTATTGDGGGDVDNGGDTDNGGVHGSTEVGAPPKTIDIRVMGGIGKVSSGDISVPIEPSINLAAAYPIPINPQLVIDVGVHAAYVPVPYTMATGEKKTGAFINGLVGGSVMYTVAPKMDVRGDLGVGVLVLSGVTEAGNPFTKMGAATSGALGMFAVRVGAAFDYGFTPNVYATLNPAVVYSPAKDGLNASQFTRFDVLVGVGYRM